MRNQKFGKTRRNQFSKGKKNHHLKLIAVFACISERLKYKILITNWTDNIVFKQDAYWDLPRLIESVKKQQQKENAK